MSDPALVARASKLGPSFDLLANYQVGGFFFERSGLGVSGIGVAHTISIEAGPERILRMSRMLADRLVEIRRDVNAPAPVAVAAIPFGDDTAAEAAIPARAAVRRDAGETWQIDVVAAGLAPLDTPRERWTGRAIPFAPFADMQLRPDPEPDDYAAAVDRATKRIRANEFQKVVLARSLIVDAERELDAKQLLWRLRAVDPDCYAFATLPFGAPPGAILVGASPELLVSRHGRDVRATPLAGSAQRFGDASRDRASGDKLFRSEKEREEHRVVVEDVAHVLGAFCDELEHPHEPELLGTANVWHLATPFRGRLHDPGVSVLELVAALHPTPAVCGTPRGEAREALAELEPIDRGAYAGPVGWVDAKGDGEWAIALRCAEITGKTARLFAGAGIVADSVPEAEVDETERKFRALLDALRWG
ncbi:MAG TPA: isochorismate synthase [Gaiellaceae bacterium]|nr:isochorismate synthase [Gaiellaceae bacterium]